MFTDICFGVLCLAAAGVITALGLAMWRNYRKHDELMEFTDFLNGHPEIHYMEEDL
jgi:hypothetical protein